MNTIDRILRFIEVSGLNKSKFEKTVGLSNGYLNSVKGSIGSKKIEDILTAYPQISKVWLLTGEGEMLKEPNTKKNTDEPKITPIDNNQYLELFKQAMDAFQQHAEAVKQQGRRLDEILKLLQYSEMNKTS